MRDIIQPMTDIVFLDLETTGVRPEIHAIIEIGMVLPPDRTSAAIDPDWEIWIQLTEEELGNADSDALKVNGYNRIARKRDYKYYEESSSGDVTYRQTVRFNNRHSLALDIAEHLDGALLAGNNVKFDQQFLELWLRRHGACPTWDYRVLDVPTYAAGVWNGMRAPDEVLIKPPFSSAKVAKAFNVPEPEEAHTALGDALWAKRLYEAAVHMTTE